MTDAEPAIISQLDHLRVLHRDGLYVVQRLDDVGGSWQVAEFAWMLMQMTPTQRRKVSRRAPLR